MAIESLTLVPLIPTQALELNLATNIRNLTLVRDKVAVGDPATDFIIKPNADGSINTVDLSGSGGIAQADLSAFFETVTFFNPIGGERKDVTISIPDGKAGVARLTPFRAIHLNLRDNVGTELLGQKLMADSIPVTLASDQSPTAVTIVPTNAATGVSAGIRTLGGGTAGSLNVVRATTYTEQTVNAQRSFASSSASDTGAGTGAQQVTLTYYDATGAGPFTEVVTLAGVVAVATTMSRHGFSM